MYMYVIYMTNYRKEKEYMFDIVYGNYPNEEYIEEYEDIDDARADFITLSNEDYDYIILRKIDIDEEGNEENIEIIDEVSR